MKFSDRYDAIINYIEENLDKKSSKIVANLCDRLLINSRMLGEGFQFITGLSIAEYVRHRRVINSLMHKLETGCSLEEAAEQFDFPDQPTLSKSCKEALGMSPSQVTIEILNKYPPLTLQQLLIGDADRIPLPQRKLSRLNVFGTDREKFSEIREILEMNSLYDFDDAHIEMVYQIHKEFEVDLEQAFDLVEHLVISKDVLEVDNYPYTIIELAYLYFKYDLSYSRAEELISMMKQAGISDITMADTDCLNIFINNRDVSYYKLSWKVCSNIINLCKCYNVPLDSFDAILEKAIFLCSGDILLAVTLRMSFDEILDYLEEHHALPQHIIEQAYSGIVSEELQEISTRMKNEYAAQKRKDSIR